MSDPLADEDVEPSDDTNEDEDDAHSAAVDVTPIERARARDRRIAAADVDIAAQIDALPKGSLHDSQWVKVCRPIWLAITALGSTTSHHEIETKHTELLQRLSARVGGTVGAHANEISDMRHRGEKPPREIRLWIGADIAADIAARAGDLLIPLAVADGPGAELASIPPGEVAVVVGPTGSGKTSLTLAMSATHARNRGLAVYVSCEMRPGLVGARALGQTLARTWPAMLAGSVPEPEMVAAWPARLIIVERRDSADWRQACEKAREQHPDVPMLVVIDYLQILPVHGESRDPRARVSQAVDEISAWADDNRAAMIILSQTSRAAARALRSGEAVGWSATDAGAESAAIERAAHVVLAIGERGPDREDGSHEVTVSIGKHRMGCGDQVVSTAYHGATGRWSVLGSPRRADAVKVERAAAKDERNVANAAVLVAALLSKAPEPMSRTNVSRAIGKNKATALAAIEQLLATKIIVEVNLPKRPLWTPAQASAANIAIIDETRDIEEFMLQGNGAKP